MDEWLSEVTLCLHTNALYYVINWSNIWKISGWSRKWQQYAVGEISFDIDIYVDLW